uniref:1-aminocyclopropane-1-carboxylate synthase-like protein 1 n=1 Tax=Denticeps clupeoides TaxID=299321 RepID=A0AAY4B606_9TELE
MAAASSRYRHWSEAEVAELLHIWADGAIQIDLEPRVRNQHVFGRIAGLLNERGVQRTGEQCREKIEKLELEYRRAKDRQKATQGKERPWKFFAVMDRVLADPAGGVEGDDNDADPEHPAEARPEVKGLKQFLLEHMLGVSGQNMAGSPGTGAAFQVSSGERDSDWEEDGNGAGDMDHRRKCSGGHQSKLPKRRWTGRRSNVGSSAVLLNKTLLEFLRWQRAAEERREQMAERCAVQGREHDLRLLSTFAGALVAARGHAAQQCQASSPHSTPQRPGTSAPASPLTGPQTPPHSKHLSRRGNRIRQHQGILQEGYTQYHADKHGENNPNGIINMGTSENKLCHDLLHKRLSQPDMVQIQPPMLQYADWKGHRFLREEVARFLSHYCQSPSPLKADNVVVMNGCGSLFSAIAAALCDPEDAILIPTPFYGVITEDVGLYSSARLYHVHLSGEPPFHLTVEKLEGALNRAKAEGVNVKAVILVNPHNPLGEIYSAEEMTSFLEFAKKHELHAIVDEIYMLSVFGERNSFCSVLSHDRLPDPQRTHVMWGLSKDFAMGGMRVGTLYSENRHLVEALDHLGYFHCVSGTTQHQVARLLQDRAWIDWEFLPENRRRLQEAHHYLTTELQGLGVPYLHRPVGFFVWADFSKYLRQPSFSEELELWRHFLRNRVVLSCGQAFSCSTPGWFRIVFADQESCLQLGQNLCFLSLVIRETKETERHRPTDANCSQTVVPSLSSNDFVVMESQVSHSPAKLDSLIDDLRQQIRSSDWLQRNTPELSAGEDPKQLEVFTELLERARK